MALGISLGNFYGIDSIIDFLIVIVSIMISVQSNKIYNLVKEKHYKFFSLAFFSIALAFIFKILANLTIVNKVVINKPDFVYVVLHELREVQILNFLSLITYKSFLLVGFLTLFLIMTRNTKKEDIFLFIYFSLIAVILSIYFNFIFHLTMVVILSTLTYYFYENNKKVRTKNSANVYYAFVFMLVSQVIELFTHLHPWVYLLGEILMFIGFILLLSAHFRIKNGKEKNQDRSNKGLARNTAKK